MSNVRTGMNSTPTHYGVGVSAGKYPDGWGVQITYDPNRDRGVFQDSHGNPGYDFTGSSKSNSPKKKT